MSMRAFRWAKSVIAARNYPKGAERPLSSSESFVLVMLGDHYNEDWHRAWPSQATLARETGLTVKTIVRAIHGLTSEGLVVVEPWVINEGGGRIPNRYCLPKYQGASVSASDLPVIAFGGPADASGQVRDDVLKVPGSNLYIESDALTREPDPGRDHY